MSKNHKITQLKKRIAELEIQLKRERIQRNVRIFCDDVEFHQTKMKPHSYFGRFKENPDRYQDSDMAIKYRVAKGMEDLVLNNPDFMEHIVSIERSDEPDALGNYLYQWEITVAEKSK